MCCALIPVGSLNSLAKKILDAAANTADRYTVGVGKDSFTAVHRGFEDYDHVKNPVSVLGRILGPVSQDIYHQIAMSYAQVPQIDMCHFQGNLTEIYGMPITPDSPWEMFSELWSVAQVKDVCRQVCRPGLADGGIRAIAMSAMQAAFDPGWGANKGDFRCCLTLPHQKVEYKHLSRALQWHTYGINFYSVMTSYPGGLSGGPATLAVTGTAEWIIQKLLFDVPLNGSWSVDAMYFSNTSKYSLWCSNHQNAAVTKNTVCEPLTGGGWQMTHGIGHENFFWNPPPPPSVPSCSATASPAAPVPRAGLRTIRAALASSSPPKWAKPSPRRALPVPMPTIW